jgi:hypothetical protein
VCIGKILQNIYTNKIVVYDPDKNSFDLYDSLGMFQKFVEHFVSIRVEHHDKAEIIAIESEGVIYYLVSNDERREFFNIDPKA